MKNKFSLGLVLATSMCAASAARAEEALTTPEAAGMPAEVADADAAVGAPFRHDHPPRFFPGHPPAFGPVYPAPPPPAPVYPGYYGGPGRQIECNSEHYRPATCYVGYANQVYLAQQLSNNQGPCIQGQTWGYDGQNILVNNGCRGMFHADP